MAEPGWTRRKDGPAQGCRIAYYSDYYYVSGKDAGLTSEYAATEDLAPGHRLTVCASYLVE
jgi:hypothetical protein